MFRNSRSPPNEVNGLGNSRPERRPAKQVTEAFLKVAGFHRMIYVTKGLSLLVDFKYII